MENFNNAQNMKDTDNAIAIEGMTTGEIALQVSSTNLDFENSSATTPVVGTSTQLVVGTSTATAGTRYRLDVGTGTTAAGTIHRFDAGTSTETTGTCTQLTVDTSISTAGTSTQSVVCTSTAVAGGSTGNDKGKRKKMGRQNIRMEKIEKQENLQVAFSKRRKGVFKKAHELSILTGADVASIVFSPAGKVYSYGSPNLERVIDRFTTGVDRPLTHPETYMQNEKNKKVLEGNAQLEELLKQVETEKKRGEWLDQQLAQVGPQSWIPTKNKSIEDLQQSAEILKMLWRVVDKEIEKQSMYGNFMFYHGLGIPPPMHAPNPPAYARGEGSSSGSGGFFQSPPGTGDSEGAGVSSVVPYARSSGSVGAGRSGVVRYGQRFYGHGSSRGGFSFRGRSGEFSNVSSSSRPFIEGPSSYLGISSSSGVADVVGGIGGNNGGGGSGRDGFSVGHHSSAFRRVGSSGGPFTVNPSSYLGHAGSSDDVNVFDRGDGISSANVLSGGGYSGSNMASQPDFGSANVAGFSADMDDGFPDMDSVFAEIARSSGHGGRRGVLIREGTPRTTEAENEPAGNSVLYGSKAKVIDWSDVKPPRDFGRGR